MKLTESERLGNTDGCKWFTIAIDDGFCCWKFRVRSLRELNKITIYRLAIKIKKLMLVLTGEKL